MEVIRYWMGHQTASQTDEVLRLVPRYTMVTYNLVLAAVSYTHYYTGLHEMARHHPRLTGFYQLLYPIVHLTVGIMSAIIPGMYLLVWDLVRYQHMYDFLTSSPHLAIFGTYMISYTRAVIILHHMWSILHLLPATSGMINRWKSPWTYRSAPFVVMVAVFMLFEVDLRIDFTRMKYRHQYFSLRWFVRGSYLIRVGYLSVATSHVFYTLAQYLWSDHPLPAWFYPQRGLLLLSNGLFILHLTHTDELPYSYQHDVDALCMANVLDTLHILMLHFHKPAAPKEKQVDEDL